MFKNLSLRLKLTLTFLILAALLSGVSYYQVASIQRFNDLFVDLIDNGIGRLDALNNLEIAGVSLKAETLHYQHDILENPRQSQQAGKTELANAINSFKQSTQAYQSIANHNAARTQLEALLKASNDLATKAQAVLDAGNASKSTRDALGANVADAAKAFDQTAAATIDLEHKAIEVQDSAIHTTISQLITAMVGVAIAFSALAVLVGSLTSIRIARALSSLKNGASRIANGDFSQGIAMRSNDEIGQVATSFNTMAARLKESYRRLAVETERDRTLLESLGEGVITVDERGRVDLINNRAIEMLELPDREHALGNVIAHIAKFYDEKDKLLTSGITPADLAIASKQSRTALLGFHKQSGAKILLEVDANPVVVNSKIAGAIMTLRDVTKEREIDRMKTEFISLASHQLRTPLSAIKWFSEMLISGDAGKLQPDQLDFAKNIADSTERMIDLVNALLNISRIESGRIMVDPKPTDLRELVAGIVNDLKAKTEEKKQTLIISVHQDLPKINLDPRLIGQVYLNLLTNAIKYTPKGGEISVFISKKDGQVISQITDNGYGIPKEQQGRIFQKFFRASNAVKVETDGTGLGLYLIKAVVESSGGKIWFESTEGKGTTFWFSIPLSGMKKKEGEVTLDA